MPNTLFQFIQIGRKFRSEQFLHLLNGKLILEFLDTIDPCKDLCSREVCSLTDIGGLMDEP